MSLAAAIRTGNVALLPGRRDEAWRWTDLRGLIRTLPAPAAEIDLGALPAGPFDALVDQVLVLSPGQEEISFGVAAGGQRAVALRFIAREGAQTNRVSIVVGAGAKLRLFESYEGDASAYVTHTAVAIELEPGASVERVILAVDGAEGVNVSEAEVTLAEDCEFGQSVLTDGARRQRIETRIGHPGASASVRLDGAYLLAGKRHADLTTTVDHLGPDGSTSQLAKGVVRDQARGVFQGQIVVEEGADRTDARMGHHALILSDHAEVDAKPVLLIHADDVQCAHGNTVGALDEDAMFYMRQRGLSEAEARALLVEGFVGEVVDRIWNEAARDVARDWIAARLRTDV